MKKAFSSIVLLALAAAPVFAQSPSPAPDSSPAPAASPGRMAPPLSSGMNPGMHVISPEDRQTLMDASKKADEDPTVKAAKQKVLDAMKDVRELMLKKDPTLAPVLSKMEAAAAGGPQTAGSFKPTPDEATKMNAARASIKGTPEEDALKNAIMAYRDARRNAMSADPAVATILNKLRMAPRPPAPPGAAPAAAATPASSPETSPAASSK